jgi:hypothetical protein
MATKSRGTKKVKSDIEDIDHEHIERPAQEKAAPIVEEAVVVDDAKNLELTIAREIKRFNLADAGIEALKKQYGELVISGVDDKAGYKAVREAWSEVRSTRTALEKKGLAIRNDYTVVTKAVKKEEDRLIDALTPLEEDLYKKWKAIDEQKEAEKKRLAEEEQARLNTRIDEIMADGAKFSDGYYGIGGTIAIDVATLRTMPDEQYGKLRGAVQAKAKELQEEADRLAEEKRVAAEKLAADQKKLKDEQDALQKQQADFQTAQAELARQKKEQEDARRGFRLDMLEAVGMTISAGGKEVAYDNGFGQYKISIEEIDAASDPDFKSMLATAKERVADAKKKLDDHEAQVEKDAKLLAAKKIAINEVMIIAGFQYNYATESFNFYNDFANMTHTMAGLCNFEIDVLKEEAIKWAAQIAEATEKQTERNSQQAAARQQETWAKAGDGVNLGEYFQRLKDVKVPAMKTDKYKNRINDFQERFHNLMLEFKPAEEVPA